MKIFHCGCCGARLHFENTTCLSCGSVTGYLPDRGLLVALEAVGDGNWRPSGADLTDPAWRMCRNYSEQHVCNWMVPASSPDGYCTACAPNRTIPNLSSGDNLSLWGRMEAAKRRLVHTLLRLGLPVIPKSTDPACGMAFEFLADSSPDFSRDNHDDRVITGHQSGVITINLAEADDAVREKMRLDLREVYRTLLGHFRHESGHYYWDLLIRDNPGIDAVRSVFGDERTDYAGALQLHYTHGTPPDWQQSYVTPYAAAHPWEDWAETWAHYLHIMDTMETAAAQGLEIHCGGNSRRIADPFDRPFDSILEDWHALRLVLNSLNRSMGLPDAYPFVISATVAGKLAFLHARVRR